MLNTFYIFNKDNILHTNVFYLLFETNGYTKCFLLCHGAAVCQTDDKYDYDNPRIE
jgi:hypothetical protein